MADVPEQDQGALLQDLRRRYWRKNLVLMGCLLTVWLMVSLGCGVVFADVLNRFYLQGYPLGFWFAQQGSILVFVLLILAYCVLMNHLDTQHHREVERLGVSGDAS